MTLGAPVKWAHQHMSVVGVTYSAQIRELLTSISYHYKNQRRF